MDGIINKIMEVLGGIPVLGDIIKTIMGMFSKGEDQSTDQSTDANA